MALTLIPAFPLGFEWPSEYGASGTLKLTLTQDIVSEGVRYLSARPHESLASGFAVRAAISVVGTAASVGSFSLPKTDEADPTTARYVGQIYDAQGRPREIIIGNPSGWVLDSSLGDTASFQAWAAYNAGTPARRGDTFPTTAGMAAYVAGQLDALVIPTVESMEHYARDYPSLALAVTDIGSTETTLIIDNNQAIAASLTVPSNIALKFTGGGKVTVAPSQALTILGHLSAPPVQIFSGTGTVRFTGTYPENFFTEWWGVTANGVADDLPAFQKMHDSMQKTASDGRPVGGRVLLLIGKSYRWSDTWEVQRDIYLTSSGTWGAASITVAENKTGIIFHHISTESGIYSVANGYAQNSVIENVSLIAEDTNATLQTVTINGLTVTRTAGTNFDTSASALDGNTITIGNHEYEVASVGGVNSITLANNWPVRLSAPGGSNIVTNIGFQNLAPEWVGATINIAGTNYTISAVTPNGASYAYGATLTLSGTPAAFNDTAKIVGGFASSMTGKAARFNVYHGIDARASVVIRNVFAYRFHGNGINANSTQTPSFNLSVEPNTNSIQLDRVWADGNYGNGIYFKGVNANAGSTSHCSANRNHAFGLYDNSFLGNTHYDFHTLSNFLGAYATTQGGNNVTTLLNVYAEGDQPYNRLGALTLRIGCNLANDNDTSVESPFTIGVGPAVDTYLAHGGVSRGNLGEPVHTVLTVADNLGAATTAFTSYPADTSGGAINYSLFSASAANIGRRVFFKRIAGAADLTIFPSGADTLDGGVSVVANAGVWFQCIALNTWITE